MQKLLTITLLALSSNLQLNAMAAAFLQDTTTSTDPSFWQDTVKPSFERAKPTWHDWFKGFGFASAFFSQTATVQGTRFGKKLITPVFNCFPAEGKVKTIAFIGTVGILGYELGQSSSATRFLNNEEHFGKKNSYKHSLFAANFLTNAVVVGSFAWAGTKALTRLGCALGLQEANNAAMILAAGCLAARAGQKVFGSKSTIKTQQ